MRTMDINETEMFTNKTYQKKRRIVNEISTLCKFRTSSKRLRIEQNGVKGHLFFNI